MQIGNSNNGLSICYRYRECQKLKYQPRNDTTGEHYFMWCNYQTESAIACWFSLAAAPAPETSRGSPAKKKRLDNEDNTGHELFQAWVVVSCVNMYNIVQPPCPKTFIPRPPSFLFGGLGIVRQSRRLLLLLETLFFVWNNSVAKPGPGHRHPQNVASLATCMYRIMQFSVYCPRVWR